jgi:hypothetical protein
VASFKFRLWWVLWVRVCPWLVMHQKCSNYTLTNLLFNFYVWIIDPLVIRFSPHHGAPIRPFTHKVLWAREHTPTPYPFIIFTFGLTVESIKNFGGKSYKHTFHPFCLGVMLHKSNKCGDYKQKMHPVCWSNWGIYDKMKR